MSKSKCRKHLTFGPLLEVDMSEKCRPLWREADFEVKMCKAHQVRSTSEVEMLKKCMPLWREARFQVKRSKPPHARTTFEGSDVVFVWQAQGILHLAISEQNWGGGSFVAFSKTMAGVGHLKRIWKDACHVAGVVQETCLSEMLGGQGADFLRGVAFWSIRFSGLLR